VRDDRLEPGESLFIAGTEAYRRRDWSAAASAFGAAEREGLAHPALYFLLGATQLMQGDAAAADRTLERVAELGDAAYGPEAAYLRAKAKLRLGDPDEALLLLRATDHPPAAALADSVERLLAR
jgi:hypothetical protein